MITEPSKEEFEIVCRQLKYEELNFRMIGNIFGQPFWELMLLALIDSKVAYAELLEKMK